MTARQPSATDIRARRRWHRSAAASAGLGFAVQPGSGRRARGRAGVYRDARWGCRLWSWTGCWSGATPSAPRCAAAWRSRGPGRCPWFWSPARREPARPRLVEHVLATTSTPVLRGRAAAWACPAYEVVASALRPAVRSAAGPLPAVLAQVMPELGASPAEPSPAALAAAVCSVLAAAAGGRALTLFLDDLQWADEASLGLAAGPGRCGMRPSGRPGRLLPQR